MTLTESLSKGCEELRREVAMLAPVGAEGENAFLRMLVLLNLHEVEVRLGRQRMFRRKVVDGLIGGK